MWPPSADHFVFTVRPRGVAGVDAKTIVCAVDDLNSDIIITFE